MDLLILEFLLPIQAALVGALFRLDKVVLLQGMLHRPVFIAPLIGWLTGHLHESVQVAMITEFISLLHPPTGMDLPPDESGWAVITMIAILVSDPLHIVGLPLLLAGTVIWLPLLRNLEVAVRLGNGRLARHADDEWRGGRPVPFKRLVFSSVLGQTLLFSLFFLAAGVISGWGLELFVKLLETAGHIALGSAVLVVALLPILWVRPAVVVAVGDRRWSIFAALGCGSLLGYAAWLWS